LYLLDPAVTTASMLARILALMGSTEQALAMATTSLDLASRLGHPYSIAYATFWIGWVRQSLSNHDEACRDLETAIELCRAHDLPQIREWARIVRGSALAGSGRVADGIAEIRTSLDNQRAMGCFLERPYCLTALAEALILDGEAAEALTLCDEALDVSTKTEARSYVPETRRVRGEAILACRGKSDAHVAAEQFRVALNDALRADCRLLALRAAVSRFRLAQQTATDLEARSTLAELVDGYAGQRDFALLSSARRLLDRA